MQSLLPHHASQVRGIYELNSPRRIYDEWMCLSQEITVPTVEPPQKYPKPDELDQMFYMLSNKILSDLSNTNSTPVSITNQIFTTAQMINGILNNYSNLVNLPAITSVSESPNGEQLRNAVSDLETANANSVAILNQFTSHCEILANSNIPMRKHWNILGNLNNLFFTFMKDYVSKLRRMFQIIPYERVMQGVSGAPLSNPIATASFRSISYNFAQNTKEDPQIQALKDAASQLLQFIESFRLIGYTWRSTLISTEYQNQCQSLANEVYKKIGVVDKMYEFYASLPPNEQYNITPNYQYPQIKDIYEKMRSKLNILKRITNKFTLETVYLHGSSFIKQLSLTVKELRSIVDKQLISTSPSQQTTKSDILNALKNQSIQSGSYAISTPPDDNPYAGLEPQPNEEQPGKHAALKFSFKKKQSKSQPQDNPPPQPGLISYPKP